MRVSTAEEARALAVKRWRDPDARTQQVKAIRRSWADLTPDQRKERTAKARKARLAKRTA
jgi:hypothetical protein